MIRVTFLCSAFLLLSCGGPTIVPSPAPPRPLGRSAPAPTSSVSSGVLLPQKPEAPATPEFSMTRVMIPVRDGVKLETTVFAPKDAKGPLPILFLRSPYGMPPDTKVFTRPSMKALVSDGYIWVWQNLRGRFGSEGTFMMSRPPRDRKNPTSIDESTDAYDSIEWLVHNVPANNGRVGMMGTSYDAWTAVMALLEPHPALKAVVEEASPYDQFVGDDFHHMGAFRLAYGFEYVALLESTKEQNTFFEFGSSDIYDFHLKLGPLSNANDRYFHGKMPTWNDFVAHPNEDAFWLEQSLAPVLTKTPVPVMHVAGFWDQEDVYGPFAIYAQLEKKDEEHRNHIVAGPWNHGGWFSPGKNLGPIDFGSETGEYFRSQIKAPFLASHLHEGRSFKQEEATIFQSGKNIWRTFNAWPPTQGVTRKKLFLHAERGLSFEAPKERGAAALDTYVSDPENPVPFVPRPISPLFASEQWRDWLVVDQRFVDHRPDVLSYETEPLDHEVTIAGDVVADLFASTSGTDCDWVVKLIDVYPEGKAPEPPKAEEGAKEPPKAPVDLRGYQLMISGKVLRSRFRESLAKPKPVPAGKVVHYSIDLQTHAHTFLAGHRIMVQVQSTWFPVIDRNPQTYVENIYKAQAKDFVAATQRISRSADAPSSVVLPVME